jgi:hypothetical protein
VALTLFLHRLTAQDGPGNSRHFPVVWQVTELKDRDDIPLLLEGKK